MFYGDGEEGIGSTIGDEYCEALRGAIIQEEARNTRAKDANLPDLVF